MSRRPNRLLDETSPYLLQHAHNPVDWWPWCDEALQLAREQRRPILLSVGYSACHWCHVMERECFEDADIAAQMNRDFVCIKVDREERPDIDELYMKAVQLFTRGRGGWPMTVFLTADGRPFAGGTYFPPEPRQGMPSFKQVMSHAIHLHRGDRGQLDEQSRSVLAGMARHSSLPAPANALRDDWLEVVAKACSDAFDEVWGGFGAAPKFPPHQRLTALQAHAWLTGSKRSSEMVEVTLDNMALGSMWDLLDGGFCRYSVDERWLVPHFEKMLYDNAQLLAVYVTASQQTQKPRFARVATETAEWLLRRMQAPEGGFYAALDADTEGEEGRYYAWSPADVRQALGADREEADRAMFGITDNGTFERGTSVLRLSALPEDMDGAQQAALQAALPKLRAHRERRSQPARDEKILASWNALTVAALAKAGAHLDEARWLEAAKRAACFLLDEQSTVDAIDGRRRLMRSHKDGRATIPAFADDYALLIDALVELHQADFNTSWLHRAVELADQMLELFWDRADGGLFVTGADAERLVLRSKAVLGGAVPSANGAAALALLRLGTLTGRDDFIQRAQRIVRSYQQLLPTHSVALGRAVIAGAWLADGGRQIAVLGGTARQRAALVATTRANAGPFDVVHSAASADIQTLPWLPGKELDASQATAFVCKGRTCSLPVTAPADLRAQLIRQPRGQDKPLAARRPAELPIESERWLGTEVAPQLADLRGKVVILDFWTYCCVNCLHMIPIFRSVGRQFGAEQVQVLGIHCAKFPAEQSASNVARAMQRHDVRHPVLLDAGRSVWSDFGLRGWPTTVVLDREGHIAWQRAGEIDEATLTRIVARLVGNAGAGGAAATASVAAARVAATRRNVEERSPRLKFPGKVHAHGARAATASSGGFDDAGWLYVSDTAHHRLIEARLLRGDDGWPDAVWRRSFGGSSPGLRDGAADVAAFRDPQGVHRHGDTLYVADTGNHAIRAIDLRSGVTTTIAGTGHKASATRRPGPTPTRTDLRSPWDVLYASGALFIAMAGSHQLWLYMPEERRLVPFCGTGAEDHIDGPLHKSALAQPSALGAGAGMLFFVDAETSSVRVVDLQRRETGTIVGKGLFDFGDRDGAAANALLQHPLGLVADDAGLLIADTYNHKIKRIDLRAQTVTTAVGATAQLCEPADVSWSGGRHAFIADTGNHRVIVMDRVTGTCRPLQWR